MSAARSDPEREASEYGRSLRPGWILLRIPSPIDVAVDFDQREILGKIDELLDLCLRALSEAFGVVSVLLVPVSTGFRGGVLRGREPALSWRAAGLTGR